MICILPVEVDEDFGFLEGLDLNGERDLLVREALLSDAIIEPLLRR